MRSRESLSKLVKSCGDVASASQLHSLLLRSGLVAAPDCFFATLLTASYARVSSAAAAHKVFDDIPHPNTFLYNALLRAHSRARRWPQTLRLFRRMAESLPFDAFTLPLALKACGALAARVHGKAVHAAAVRALIADSDVFVGAALVEMYSRCGDMGSALKVFDDFPEPDVVLRTSVVSGYQQNGCAEEAVSFFSRAIVGERVVPDPVTLVSVASALAQLGDIRSGKSCHGFVIKMGFGGDLSLANSVLNLYVKLGAVGIAQRLFGTMSKRDVITWSCMISCYAQHGDPSEALKVYKMMVEAGLEPSLVTVVSVLQACAIACDLNEGRRVHEVAVRKGFELETSVSTALIDMYMKCSCCNEAMDLFRRMPEKDAVSWAAVIGGLSQNGMPSDSLKLFQSMLSDRFNPDAVVIVKVLNSCSQLAILRQALCFHGYLVTSGFDSKVFVRAALIDLYSKSGSLEGAVQVFETMRDKDVVLWSSMIAGYGIHGLGNQAVATFDRMIQSSIEPNSVTFVSVLSACSHAGSVEEGKKIFESMSGVYGVRPNSDHCGIMVDLLGRAGELREAMTIIEGMNCPVGPHIWCALLAACRMHHNTEIGELVASKLFKLNPDHSGYYSLLSYIYALDEKWENVKDVMGVAKERGLRKSPGCSAVEVGSKSGIVICL
ncbi:putative pentatricopeptide repeat-containing protein At3g01580 [Ananas comosus]|uniref:Pentatricopeptide repeat-containing protein At3g01580 n=1 Tax=Ananas comosus TaxID=4615 RepID=A0A6P5FHU1_ANACO|nr:putative pentatricopeptide repeat-containing protein At3g01580 [Ananas comosus]XP_020092791.1 putative pentatricopeptide repeat-containing protein At3g01580 [Ananas comosus]